MGLVARDDGWRMPDWLWERIEPLIPPPPPHPLGTHRRGLPKRQVMDAILLVLRTGMQWNALNATGICTSSTAHRRFQEWVDAGVFHEIWRQGLLDYDAFVGIDWEWLVARRPVRIRPTGPKRGETFGSHGGRRGPDRSGARGCQPQRSQAPKADAGLDPHRPARADPRALPGPLPRQGLRQRREPRHRPRPRP
jgi:putative transposase